nr:hypothetical protein [Tanacetum cinerariifolium]GFA26123.1 hypothetical protein [Tanacetum cinerariifolium]
IRRRRYNLIPAESKFKNLVLDHQDKFMMKAQVHVSKSSAISDEQALPRRKHYCQIYQMLNFTSGWRALNDDDDVLDVPSLDLRYNTKKLMCGLMYKCESSDNENVVLYV